MVDNTNKARKLIQQLLALAEITIDGPNPWDMQVKNPRIFEQLLLRPDLALGEGYTEGWWECERLDEFFCRLLRSNYETMMSRTGQFFMAHFNAKLNYLVARFRNYQSRSRAFIVGEYHYDIGNELYQYMLDPRMNYSCGYWKQAHDLDQAQEAKLELICQKLQLKPGLKVLDIGCGWGGFAKYASEKYDVSVLGVTVSKRQQQLAQEVCAGLPVAIKLQDYRELNEKFDRICSIGMFEHVGYKNYRTFMQVANRCLTDDGLFLLHTIGNNYSTTVANAWIVKYIFPNGALPSIAQIGKATEKLFVMEDWHNFGADYDKTLMAWYDNFNRYWTELKSYYDERFRRMWNYYLLSCAGAFRARDIQLWQLTFSKKGVVGGYKSIR